MFTVHCAGHGSRVLLTNRQITNLVNTAEGIELHWRCSCGTGGVEILGQLAAPRVAHVAPARRARSSAIDVIRRRSRRHHVDRDAADSIVRSSS